MKTSTTATKSPKLPASKVTRITDAKPRAAAPDGEKKANPNKITAAKMQRVLTATTKRLNRLAAFFGPDSDVCRALRDAAVHVEHGATEVAKLPADWKPIRSQTARAFASLTQGGKCRIAKGLVEKYTVLLDEEDGATAEEKAEALSELLVVKLGEKNSVVRTANGTRFAINTKHLRTL